MYEVLDLTLDEDRPSIRKVTKRPLGVDDLRTPPTKKTMMKVDLAELAAERERRQGKKRRTVVGQRESVIRLNWNGVQKHTRDQEWIDYSVGNADEEGDTWCWSINGVVNFKADGTLEAYGDKTQLSAWTPNGRYNKANPKSIAARRRAHVEAFAGHRKVDSGMNPVGGQGGVPIGHVHRWVYANSNRGPPPMQVPSGEIRLRDFHWDERKGDAAWSWKWAARYESHALEPGLYVIVADQNATRLRTGKNTAYNTRMIGCLLPFHHPWLPPKDMRRPTGHALTQYLDALPRNFTGGNNIAENFARPFSASSLSSSSSSSSSSRRQSPHFHDDDDDDLVFM